MAAIPKNQKKQDKLLKTLLIGEELEAEYNEVCNEAFKVAKEIDALINKVNEAKSKIKESTQTKDGPIVIDDYWTRKICQLEIEIWADDFLILSQELDSLCRERDYLHLHMKNKVFIGLRDGKNLVAKNKGKDPKEFRGLSIVDI